MNEREKNLDQNVMQYDDSVAAKLERLVSSPSYKYMREVMIDMLHLDKGEVVQICDIGCGEGALCRDLSKQIAKGSQIIGLDTSKSVLDIAQNQTVEGNGTIAYIIGDMMRLPFANNSCDIVVCAGALNYVMTEEREKFALEEMMRVLRLGGTLLVLDNDDYSIMYSGVKDEKLGEKVLNAYAQLHGDPQCGNKLAELCAHLELENVEYRKVLLEETNDFSLQMAGRAMADNIRDVLILRARNHQDEALVTEDEVKRFYEQIQEAVNKGRYQWKYSKYALVGKKKG